MCSPAFVYLTQGARLIGFKKYNCDVRSEAETGWDRDYKAVNKAIESLSFDLLTQGLFMV